MITLQNKETKLKDESELLKNELTVLAENSRIGNEPEKKQLPTQQN